MDVSRLFRVIVLGGAALGTGCGSTPDDSCSGAACSNFGQASASASSTTGTWTGRGSTSGTGAGAGTTGGSGPTTTGTSTGGSSGGTLLPDGGVNFW